MRYSDSLSPVPPRSVAFAQQYHLVETKGPPRFLGDPQVYMPALRPRRDLRARPWVYGKSGPGLRTFRRTRLPRTMPASLLANIPTTRRYCLPYIHTTSAPTTNLFRGSITQLRKTRFRPVASLYRAGLATRWVPLQGFSNASSLLPPCPSFPGARGLKYVMFSFIPL
jgi:hypothetical protein